jgi:hypothetical protein
MTVVVPAGQALGAMAGSDDGAVVRLGADFHTLSPGAYRLWLHAIGAGDLAELHRRAEADGLTEGVDDAVEDLFRRGLLVSFDPAADYADVLARHVLVAQGSGQGVVDDPDVFVVVDAESNAVVGLDAAVYAVWTLSCRAPLATSCALAADRLGLPEGDVRHAVAEDLGVLVGSGAAILDLAPEADA